LSDLSPPLRLGVVGCGRVFERFHLPAIARVPTVEVVTASDADAARLRWAESRSPRPVLASSLEELLAQPRLEALLVLTPPASHAEIAVRALNRGLHVLVEKPMSLDPNEARRMVSAAREAARRLQVGFTRRFREPYRRLRASLADIEVPKIHAIHFELAFPTASWNAETDFLGDDRRGGGVLDDVLSHQVDLVCWLLGRAPDKVRAEPRGKTAGGGIGAELRFGELAARCEAAHGPYVEWLSLELEDGSVLEASGSWTRRTRTRFPALRRQRAALMDRVALVGSRLLRRPNVTLASFERQLRDFGQAVRGASSHGATGDEGLRAVEIVRACGESARLDGSWLALG